MALFFKRATKRDAGWYHIPLAESELRTREHERIKLAFNSAYMQARCPDGMTLWITPRQGGGADVYLSPGSSGLTKPLRRRFRARACLKPQHPAAVLAGQHQNSHLSEDNDPRWRVRQAQYNARTYAPVPYTYRTLQDLNCAREKTLWPPPEFQLAPFVRRFVRFGENRDTDNG